MTITTVPIQKSNTFLLTFLLGLLLFIFSFPMAIVGEYELAATGIALLLSLSGIMFLIGLVLMFAGRVQSGSQRKKLRRQMMQPYPQQIIIQTPAPAPTQFRSEVTREIVKVRCRSCNSLNFETANRCTNCGASL